LFVNEKLGFCIPTYVLYKKANCEGYMNKNYLLLLVFFFSLWLIGLLDIFNHLRKRRKRKKEWAIFLMMALINTIITVLWVAFVLAENSVERLGIFVGVIQTQPLLFGFAIIIALTGIWVVSWNLLNDWVRFRFSVTIIFLTTLLVIIFANPPINSAWRMWAASIFLFFLGLEVLLQLLSLPGWLPSFDEFQSGMYHPYGRVYQTKENFTNEIMNRYGLYQPDKKINFDQSVRRIVLIGGSFIQGFQVKKYEHISQQLEHLLNSGTDSKVQIISLGMPDAGIGIYMHDLFMDIVIQEFQPDEIIFLLHASNDFQCESCMIDDQFLYSFEGGEVELRPEDGGIRHALQHIVLRGYYDTWDPLRSLRTHLLLPKFIYSLVRPKQKVGYLNSSGDDDAISTNTSIILRKIFGKREYYQDFIAVSSISKNGMRNFLFKKEIDEEAIKSFAITKALYKQIKEYLDSKSVKMRVVTIPALSPDFYKQDGLSWSSIVGDYDLFKPEKDFHLFADSVEIDFLGMGQKFQEDKLGLAKIRRNFYQDGLGHFTPDGHLYFAKSIYNTFYLSGEPRANTNQRD
jgi:hypothetical protein